MPQLVPAGFPRSKHSQLWDALVEALRADPILNAQVVTMQAWDGSEEDDREKINADDLPFLGIDSGGGQMAWRDECSHTHEWPIRITLGVEGTRLTDLLDYWQAVVTALFTGNTLLDKWRVYGCVSKTMTGPASSPQTFGGRQGLIGQCTLTLKIRVDT